MAVDATLMESVVARGDCCLRFYAWSEPTVSLGYFQTVSSRVGHAPSRDCPLVRRATGGGAIVHDREITYSFVLPADHRLAANAKSLYLLLHETLIEALAEWSLAAKVCGKQSSLSPSDEPFLCFQRRAEGDVLLGDWKIAGSAQRRRRGAVLQHGSVLLGRSSAAPELAGLVDVGGMVVTPTEMVLAWKGRLADKCQVRWRPDTLQPAEIQRSTDLVEKVFGCPAWSTRR